MGEADVLKKFILQKLVRGKVWGGKHTPLDFVTKGIPEHYQKTHQGKKAVEKALKQLLNNSWIMLVLKRTGKGSDNHVSLNSQKVSEIKQFLTNAP
ncbi:hypothetical protein HYS49_01130 [Candidatus Woesearchaeota archaeon]|nr:hypothetical protein [Candidatus Woesearchaeota archaeon]